MPKVGELIRCGECGADVIALTKNSKYCSTCRHIVMRRQQRESHKRKQEEKKLGIVKISADTDEMRNMCLNCTRPRCGGECRELADFVRQQKKQRREVKEACNAT